MFDANLRAEEAETRAERAEVAAEAAAARADRAAAEAEAVAVRADRAEAKSEQAKAVIELLAADVQQAQIECDRARRDRDAVLTSTAWRATWPFRALGIRLPARLRRVLRVGAEIGWWSLTLQLPSKLRDRKMTFRLQR